MAAWDAQQPLFDENTAPQVIVGAQPVNGNGNAGDYISSYRRAMQDRKNNCGLQAKTGSYDCTACCYCCSLWRAAHFWTFVFVVFNGYALGTSLKQMHPSRSESLSMSIVAGFFLINILFNVLALYGVYHCIPSAIRAQHIVLYIYENVLLLVFACLLLLVPESDISWKARGEALLACGLAFVVAWYPIQSYYKLYKWAQYFKQIGRYDPELTIWDVVEIVGTDQCCG
mmetsp:Transcript_4989/g.8456  ORF Transcript_4989/g.8456 Transcript_4989/m.8456 type:complete len:228 (-) Transcript_4989:43-726(-)